MRYSKPALSTDQQIDLLIERGLDISSREEATHYLGHISYYRLAGYWWNLQEDTETHEFWAGTRFADIIDRYNFDRELRLLCFNMIERIEITIRTKLIYHLSLAYGAHWFDEPSLFRNARRWSEHLNTLQKELRRSREVFIQEHRPLYACLCCMQYLLQTISPGNHFPDRLRQLFTKYPGMPPEETGAPDNWQDQPLWQ